MAEPRVAIVVPWRAGDPDRERAWRWAREWWERFAWPVIEVEHAGQEPFNRAWTINEGARRAWPWDVLVAVDADVFEQDPQQVLDGVVSCWQTGRLTVPHTVGADLDQRGTRALLAGEKRWERAVAKVRPVCTSRVTIVREDLFTQVGGFDERFRGWGHEDVAFFHTARTLRGVDHLPGTAYHLWHRPSIRAARGTPEYLEGSRLADRYLVADRQGWPAIAPILDERSSDERWIRPTDDGPQEPRTRTAYGCDVFCLTAGRREYLERTLASFEERVSGDIRHRLLLDDSGDTAFGAWLDKTYGDRWEIARTKGRTGFTRAIRAAWALEARRGGAPYLFHLEEDFVFDRDVELSALIEVLESDRKLAQVALLRGPFFGPEIDAGGIIQEDPDAYEARTLNGHRFLVHHKYFTTNPCVYRRSLLKTGWPQARSSEAVFTKALVRKGHAFALYGDGEPWVTHIGVERTNLGY